MKYVCKRKCQIRLQGHIHFFTRGEVVESEEDLGPHFTCLTPEYAIDFTKASAEELQAAEWKFADADKVIRSTYGKSLFREKGTKKSEVIEQILDARFRAVDPEALAKPIPAED